MWISIPTSRALSLSVSLVLRQYNSYLSVQVTRTRHAICSTQSINIKLTFLSRFALILVRRNDKQWINASESSVLAFHFRRFSLSGSSHLWCLCTIVTIQPANDYFMKTNMCGASIALSDNYHVACDKKKCKQNQFRIETVRWCSFTGSDFTHL